LNSGHAFQSYLYVFLSMVLTLQCRVVKFLLFLRNPVSFGWRPSNPGQDLIGPPAPVYPPTTFFFFVPCFLGGPVTALSSFVRRFKTPLLVPAVSFPCAFLLLPFSSVPPPHHNGFRPKPLHINLSCFFFLSFFVSSSPVHLFFLRALSCPFSFVAVSPPR